MNPTVTVTITDGVVVSAPTVQFGVTQGGQPVDAAWSVDQGQIGTITKAGVFTPSGVAGGTAQVTASVGGAFAATTVRVVIERTQNGSKGPIDLTGAGGYGGVGGVGPGGPIGASDQAALQAPPTADPARTFLYPYDKTVWPRGLLAPLLQWTAGANDATAIALHLQSQNFVYTGYFGRPAALGTGPFVNHPIPQDVWQQATESTSGTDPLGVSVVFLVGGASVGPISESWIVAPGVLQGTVYYESYGTLLVTNSDVTAQDGTHFGAAVLAIKAGDTAPHVVAGTNSPSGQWGQGCRGCHTVAAGGSRLITQDDTWGYEPTSLYGLQSASAAALAPPATCTLPGGTTGACPGGTFAWAGLSPDGQYALTNGHQYATDQWLDETQLFRIDASGTATQVAVSGLPPGVQGMTPAFSADGKHVAFTHKDGTLGSRTGDGHVVVMDFDAAGLSMGAPVSVFAPPAGDCVGFPSFMPTNDSLLVELQLSACYTAQYGPSYVGTGKVNGEIWWTDTATGTQRRLDALNGYSASGASYLPKGANNHDADAALNYAPTVNPAPSGGYAWVIFTSRRLYGNVATIDPSSSDPRYYDYRNEITTKKLWVAAIDLGAPAGTDPSHPAFYLPAQELHAGNARGYWVLDPCLPDGAGCQFGDQCCGGYCEADGDGGALVCGQMTLTCSQYNEKCVQASDCCDPRARCINGFCSQLTAQ
jgi:hypothetical protein